MKPPSQPWDPACLASPLFASVAETARPFRQHADWPELAELNVQAAAGRLANARDRPLRFIPQTARCSQREYEDRAWTEGLVPTRPRNWHDLFNALVWLAFPRAKATLNDLQHRSLATAAGRRGPVSDAATLFDESGLVLVARTDNMAALLRAHQWHEAFVARRDDWFGIRCYVFGHALLEKALFPFPGMTAKCLAVTARELPSRNGPSPPWLDERIAQCWSAGDIERPSDLFPLPVLGIPGLWPGNENPDFYQRTDIFRPQRPSPCTVGMTDQAPPASR
jgi:hypothetical protein